MTHISQGFPHFSPEDDRKAGRAEEWRRGWRAVAASAIGYGTGGALISLTASLFVAPMRDELGWSTTAVAFTPLMLLSMALVSPFAGAVIDRLGGRRAAFGGTLVLAVLIALLAVVPITPMMLYSIAVLMGVCCALTMVPPYTRIVATWFRRGVGLAFGMTLSGSALMAAVAIPLTSAAIQAGGWRSGFLALATIMLVIGLPVIHFGCKERIGGGGASKEPGKADTPDGVGIGAALRDPRFWSYLAVFTLGNLPTSSFAVHLQPLLADQGFPLATAVTLGVVYAIAISFGRIVGGLLLDRFWPFAVAAILLVIAGAGAAGLSHVNGLSPIAVVALMIWAIGMGQGAEADFIAYFGLRAFGMRAFSTIVGAFGLLATVASAAGGFLFGIVFDTYGSYAIAGYIAGACWALSGLLLLLIGLRDSANARSPVAARPGLALSGVDGAS